MKIPIGIFFGGATSVRDHSYQAAQRIIQLLNPEEFDPVPVLVDPFGQLIVLDELPSGESISEFYPAEEQHRAAQDTPFLFYPEQLGDLSVVQKIALARSTGRLVSVADLPEIISIAFFALPDVSELQQSLHVLRIPHTGELTELVELCADRYSLRLHLQKAGFEMPASIRLSTRDWQDNNIQAIWGEDSASVAYPLLIRPAFQYGAGRSTVVDAKDGPEGLRRAIDLAFGQKRLDQEDWLDMSPVDRENFVQHLAQWSSGVGFPLEIWRGNEKTILLDPASLLTFLHEMPIKGKGKLLFRAQGANEEILVSSLPEGTAISCVLIRNNEHWDTTNMRILGNSAKIVMGVDVSNTIASRPLKIADSMMEQIVLDCHRIADDLHGQVALRIFGVLNSSGKFIPEEVQVFSGPDGTEKIDAEAIKSFIIASLRAGQERHPAPVYRSLLELLTGEEVSIESAEKPVTAAKDIVPPVTSAKSEPEITEEEIETPDHTAVQEEEPVTEPSVAAPEPEIYLADRTLYERELQKLNREKDLIPASAAAPSGAPDPADDSGNLWTNMKLFFRSRLLWKNVGAIAAFLLLLFLTVNIALRMYTRHGDSMQLEDYRGLLLQEAERKAAAKDLRIKVQNSVFVLGKRPGEIYTQYPLPLSKVKEDRTIFVTIYKEQGGDVVLPAFTEVGDDLQSYREALGNRKVTLIVRSRSFDAKLAEGTILYLLVDEQKITNTELRRNDVKVSEGSTVEAVVSTRISATVDMPNLVCQAYDEAVFHLQGKELVLGKVYGGSDGNRSGYYVWKQEPTYAPGKLIPKGSQVDVYLIPTKPDECE
jgi:beta-lactam-binding protein with PASTA domain/D-alanine-D-alanine ligase-like ATP-grasp enzyme